MSSLEFRSKILDETRNYFLDEVKHNDLKSGKYKKTCKYLKYVEDLLMLVSTVTGRVSFSSFASLVCVPISITSSIVGVRTCAITPETKNYKSFIKIEKRNLDEIVLLGEAKSNTIEVLISKALIGSYICHEEFVSVKMC